jgi:DNA-binding NtrC family response regulator
MVANVFVLDADPQERKWIESALAPISHGVVFLEDELELLAHVGCRGEVCLIAFADRDEVRALDLIRKLRRAGSRLPVVVLGHHSAFRTAVDIARLEGTNFLERPVSVRELRVAVRRACEAAE